MTRKKPTKKDLHVLLAASKHNGVSVGGWYATRDQCYRLYREGLLDAVGYGRYVLTDTGLQILKREGLVK
jgi:hypothetical protein